MSARLQPAMAIRPDAEPLAASQRWAAVYRSRWGRKPLTPTRSARRGSQAEVAAGRRRESFCWSDVVVEQGAEVAVPGLGGDSVDRGTVDGGCGGVSGTQRVAGDRNAVETGRNGSFLDESADGSGSDALVGDAAGIDHAGEERARSSWADAEPVVERPDRVGESIVAASDTDELTASVLIGLGAADIDEDAGGLGDDVSNVEAETSPGLMAEA